MTNEQYYLLMRDNGMVQSDRQSGIEEVSELISQLMIDGYLSYDVIVDDAHEEQMLIYEHIDPIDGKSNDMRAICLNEDDINMGNVIKTQDGRVFMSVTKADWNGAYNKYKIRELTDDMRFTVDEPVTMKCVVANKGFYDEISYINDANVFEDKDTRATIVQYNPKTSQLGLFDDVYINNIHYKIVKIDNYTLKEYDEEFGVLQLVVIDTPFGEIKKNGVDTIDGIVTPERVKDKILNSISKALYCYHNEAKRGDYINFKYDRDKKGTMVTETYLIVNKPTMSADGYDTSLLNLCESKMNLLDNEGNIVNVDVYFENNRMRIDRTSDGEFMKFTDSSYMIIVQSNEATMRVDKKIVSRVIIDGKPYDVTGTDANSKGLVYIGLELGKKNPTDDDFGVANYHSQMKDINGDVIEINGIHGINELIIGETEEYTVETDCVWSLSGDGCILNNISSTKCTVSAIDDTDFIGKSVTLYADISGNKINKDIRIVGW